MKSAFAVLVVMWLAFCAEPAGAYRYWEQRDRNFVCVNTVDAGLICTLNADTFRDGDLDYMITVRRDTVFVNGDAAFDTGAFLRLHPKTVRLKWPRPRGWSHSESGVRCQGAIHQGAPAVLCGRADGTGYRLGITRRTVFVTRVGRVVWSRAQPH